MIIAGHTRWKAAKKLGLAKAPVHVAKELTPAQIQAYRIADNQTATLAEWDKELLPIELGQLKEAGYDLGLLSLGALGAATNEELLAHCRRVAEGIPLFGKGSGGWIVSRNCAPRRRPTRAGSLRVFAIAVPHDSRQPSPSCAADQSGIVLRL